MVRREFLSETWCAADKSESFFVGDAGGRLGDFSDSDKWVQPSLAVLAHIAISTGYRMEMIISKACADKSHHLLALT